MFSRRHPGAMHRLVCTQSAAHGVVGSLMVMLLLAMLLANPAAAGAARAEDGGPVGDRVAAPAAQLVVCYGVYHLVRAGETIYSIAGAYGSSAYRIRYCNGLASYSVYTGQTLLIPIYHSR